MLQGPASPAWAVIDIGSNSVRLVVYDGPPRSPLLIFNEKILCGLGERDLMTGALRADAVKDALRILSRFHGVVETVRPRRTFVFATSAVRDAPNGPAFLDAVRAIGLSPQLITGDEEARFAALGVLSGAPEILAQAGGALAGDIGGGSLELCHIHADAADHLGDRVSLPLGALRLASEQRGDRDAARAVAARAFAGVPWLRGCAAPTLYLVGGAWRALARIAMERRGYPVHVLDHFRLGRAEALTLCQFVARQSIGSLEAMAVVQRRRAPTLPFAAIVLEELLLAAPIERLEVSSNGVREGILYAELSPEEKAHDPLIALAAWEAQASPASLRPMAEALTDFLMPLFAGDDGMTRREVLAAVYLSNIAAHLQPEERADQAAARIMALTLRGVDHAGRVRLAAALHARHGGSASALAARVPLGLIDESQQKLARILGAALRFAISLDPSGRTLLAGSKFTLGEGTLGLIPAPGLQSLWAPGPGKRFERVAEAMGRKALLPFDSGPALR